MDYTTENHSKHLLMAHLIFVCKYRKHLLRVFEREIKELLCTAASEKQIEILEIETDKDHVHMLVKYSPKYSILYIVTWLKQASTFRLWRLEHTKHILEKHFWKEKTFWSDGYFSCSIGNVSKETIEKYIQSQG
jgi:putative transposase